ncbi:MAG TPA: 2-phospho-L-lactate guanylyltransferase [Candidatus Nesterenkonia stercoripullorum]|uniref:2-phospho-L-lactate guanylyltransferase n=1 Tax=Candidatus Nesterenkonia stercoripullorum TaxID=2838701 RepID=A0A9D1US86_9MICC|nr:2-phospho-L-lactate guanylyltransferase [Candidatus Nesterenkonia stercoripullorum]
MQAGRADRRWTLVIPVRDPRTGKSRLGASEQLNTAIAADTVSAALDCPDVGQVTLVTDEIRWIPPELSSHSRCAVILQGAPSSVGDHAHSRLNAAISQGIKEAERSGSPPAAIAVLLGDIPALDPAELSSALHAARGVERGMVSDFWGSGTTLITTLDTVEAPHRLQFGPGSADRHRAAGYLELPVPATSSLRRDVDTAEDLRAVHPGLGAESRAVLNQGPRTGPSSSKKAEVA